MENSESVESLSYCNSFNLNSEVRFPMVFCNSMNLKDMCRFCFLCRKSVKYLLSDDELFGESHKILDYFTSFANVQMLNEDCLNKTCEECLDCAKFIYCFKRQCESAQDSLKEYLNVHPEFAITKFINSDCSVACNDDVECEETSDMKCNEIQQDGAQSSHKTSNSCQQDTPAPVKDKKALCTECGKTFTRRADLSRHILTHSQAKPYNCNECPRGFNQRYALVQHLRYHTGMEAFYVSQMSLGDCCVVGQASFICDVCGKGFVRKASMEQHRTLHSGVRKYKCNICDTSFTTSAHLNRHMRIHSGERPHRCDECGKSFTTRTGYVVHSRSHTSVKPYQCLYCDRACATSTALKIHTRNHTGERPYKCEQCDATFTRSDLRTLHIKSSHTGTSLIDHPS